MRAYVRPFLIGFAGFLIGGACVYAFLGRGNPVGESSRTFHSDKPIVSAFNLPKKEEEETPSAPLPPRAQARAGDDFENEDPFAPGQDPFLAMRKMREQMEKQMRAGFAAGLGFDDMEADNEITTTEDDKSVSYEIKDVVGGSLNTQVKDGYLTVSGESKQVNGSISVQSSFHRSFPLPRNVDATKMETISEKDRVVLRFPKKG